MNMPGFTAEASLYKMSPLYFAFRSFGQADSAVQPQSCDPTCLDNCVADCPDDFDCFDAPARQRAACFREVRACRAGCRSACHCDIPLR